MGQALTVLGLAFVSALIPVVNIEAYLGVRASMADDVGTWVLSLVAAVGQMVGKLIWYFIGASSLNWRWIRRKVEKPKMQAKLRKWRTVTDERPVFAGALVFVSAATSLPPFAILSVIAGQLRMNLTLFFVLGLLGRWVRFIAILGGVGWISDLLLAQG